MNYFNNECYFHMESIYRTQRGVLRVLQCTVTIQSYGRAGHRLSTEARWPNHGARVCVGKFERLLQLVLLKRGDPRALFGCMFLDIFAVSGPIFLKLTLLPLVK